MAGPRTVSKAVPAKVKAKPILPPSEMKRKRGVIYDPKSAFNRPPQARRGGRPGGGR